MSRFILPPPEDVWSALVQLVQEGSTWHHARITAYEIAAQYCSERTQFGKPLVSFQIVQDKLVKMLAEVCSMQLYCLRLGRLIEEGSLTDTIEPDDIDVDSAQACVTVISGRAAD